MPRARKHLVCVSDTPYYHVTSRCVRRAFLCGIDKYSGKSFEHRRSWIENRIRLLSSLFSIQVCAYAVMSNHYHLVVKLCPKEAATWSDSEIFDRWTSLFKGPLLVQRHLSGEPLIEVEQDTLRSIANIYRQRLASLSWFMKCLNEPIARQANAEDKCTGHFWEARFHSQALKSNKAVFSAMAYVDLNPIRARIARTPEKSDYTSVKARLMVQPIERNLSEAISAMLNDGAINHLHVPVRPLMPFVDESTNDKAGSRSNSQHLPMQEFEYLMLVDQTGRIVCTGKRGSIDPALERVNP